jgi:hypothetical protein
MGGKQSKPVALPPATVPGTSPPPPVEPTETTSMQAPQEEERTASLPTPPPNVLAKGTKTWKDTTLRPIVFGINSDIPVTSSGKSQIKVTNNQFSEYEKILETMAALSRLVYSDSGIIRDIIQNRKILSTNEYLEKVSEYTASRSAKQTSQVIPENPNLYESYILKGPPTTDSKDFGTYFSSPSDVCCIILDPASTEDGTFPEFLKDSVIIVFKGSNTLKNLKHDLYSQFTPTDFV